MGERFETIQAPLGGIMTKEVGAVSGPVVVRFTGNGGGAFHVHVAYEGSDEFYEVEGSPLESSHRLAHKVIEHLKADPGDQDKDENPDSVSLKSFSKAS